MKYLVYDPRVIVLPSLDDASSSLEFFSNSTIRHANTFENEFPSCCVAISNIQQNLFKYSKASHLSPYLAKIVFISTFRIEKMDLAERWRREFESSEAKLGRVRLFSIW